MYLLCNKKIWNNVTAFRECNSISYRVTILLIPIGFPDTTRTLKSWINVGPTFIKFEFFFGPSNIIKGPTIIKFYIFFHGLQIFSSLMFFFQHNFAYLVHVLRLFFLPNFPDPTFILFPVSIPDTSHRRLKIEPVGIHYTIQSSNINSSESRLSKISNSRVYQSPKWTKLEYFIWKIPTFGL